MKGRAGVGSESEYLFGDVGPEAAREPLVSGDGVDEQRVSGVGRQRRRRLPLHWGGGGQWTVVSDGVVGVGTYRQQRQLISRK